MTPPVTYNDLSKETYGGLLWEISDNGLEKPSYLFGTFHGSNGVGHEFLTEIPGFYEAFDSVRLYVGENDFDEDMDAIEESITKAMGEKLLPSDITYRELLTEEELQILDSALLKTHGTTSENMRLAPNFLGYTLSLQMLEVMLGGGNSRPSITVIDHYLADLAKEKGYNTEGLDRPDLAASIYAENPYLSPDIHISAKNIIKNIKDFEDGEMQKVVEIILDLENAYKRLDLRDIERFGTKKNRMGYESMKKYGKTDEEVVKMDNMLIKDRNTMWVEKLSVMMAAQPSFIGVGALHLPGKNGLINLLKQNGYTVEPVL